MSCGYQRHGIRISQRERNAIYLVEDCDGTLCVGRGDDTVGKPHRAQISQFELFELILVLKLDKQFLSSNSRQQYLSPPS